MGVIYILTNPSFKEYVKIGYADDVTTRLEQLNRSECTPFAFRIYATFETNARLNDLKLHKMIDQINPNLRSIDNIDGKKRIREFYAMTPETVYAIFETIAELSGQRDKLRLYEPTTEERKSEELAQDIQEENIERMAPFTFSKCNIPVGSTIVFVRQGNENSGIECTVLDDKHVIYQDCTYSLTALAKKLLDTQKPVGGPRYFKYNGQWLNDIRAKNEGRHISERLDDIWIIPSNPKYYDIVTAFNNLDVIEWDQTTNMSVGDTVYIYVGGNYKSIMYKCEVIGANLYNNRSDNDICYYKKMEKDPNARYMKLKLLEKYPKNKYSLKELQNHGLKNLQGRTKVTMELMKYLKNY